MKKRRFVQVAAAVFLAMSLCPVGAAAAELCLENANVSTVYYRLNYVQLDSFYSVNGIFVDGTNSTNLATAGTAFRQQDRSLVISLSTTYPNFYTHPKCTDILTFAPGKFLTATIEGTCFGSTTSPNVQYTSTYVRVPCP